MRKFILAALLALPLTAATNQQASAGCCATPTFCFNMGFKWKAWACCSCCCDDCHGCGHKKCCGGGGGGGAPWYAYWPYDGHFQTPAPTGYPYWPAPMTAGGYHAAANYSGPGPQGYANHGMPPMAQPMPYATQQMVQPMPYAPPAVQPVSYYPQQAPSYWYGR